MQYECLYTSEEYTNRILRIQPSRPNAEMALLSGKEMSNNTRLLHSYTVSFRFTVP